MRNITPIFNNSLLKNKTFKIYGTSYGDSYIESDDEYGESVYYSPYFLLSFGFDKHCDTRYNLHCLTHDIAHMIDLWEHGNEKRLLLNNFGWDITKDNAKWPRNDIFKELRTITLQGFLTKNVFGFDRELVYRPKVKVNFRRRVKPGQSKFLPTKEKWDAKVAEYERHNERVGINNYIGMWQDLCMYVKANRT